MAIALSMLIPGHLAGADTSIAASTAAALAHYNSACSTGMSPGERQSMQSESDRLIALGIESDPDDFRRMFIAQFVAIERELKAAGTESWCKVYAPVARTATHRIAQSKAGQRPNGVQRD